MSTIPGLSASNLYSYLSAMNAGGNVVNPANYAAWAQAAQLSAITTLTSSGNSPASPLTYNASGLPGSLQPLATTSNAATTPAQAAQNAYLQVEYAISQTLASMISGSSSDSSNSGLSSLFGLAGSAEINNLPGSTSATGARTQAARYAAINAQFALTQALNSPTSGTSSSGA